MKVIERNPMVGEGFFDSESPPSWGNSQRNDQPLRLFRVKVVEKKEAGERVFYDRISDLFNGLEYSWH